MEQENGNYINLWGADKGVRPRNITEPATKVRLERARELLPIIQGGFAKSGLKTTVAIIGSVAADMAIETDNHFSDIDFLAIYTSKATDIYIGLDELHLMQRIRDRLETLLNSSRALPYKVDIWIKEESETDNW